VGSFNVNISGLTANTTYYARAYASNTKGIQYGNQVQFTTKAPAIIITDTVVTTPYFNGYNNFTAYGTIYSIPNNEVVVSYGFLYGAGNLTYEDSPKDEHVMQAPTILTQPINFSFTYGPAQFISFKAFVRTPTKIYYAD
jgi:hypothetical protein